MGRLRADTKLLAVNVFLAFVAAFSGALAVAQDWNKAALAAAAYGGLRYAIGLGSVYAQRLSEEAQRAAADKGFGPPPS